MKTLPHAGGRKQHTRQGSYPLCGVKGRLCEQSVEVLQGIDRVCDEEAVRVVKSMLKWIPGRHNGRAVPVIYTVPIVFKLQ